MNNVIAEDMKNAMKNGNKFELSVLRMLKSALQMEKINKKRELEDSEIISVIKKQVKVRKDSITEYTKYNKLDSVADLEKEIEVLNKYLPEELSEEEVNKLIDEIFNEVKPTSIKDMGNIMKIINEKNINADMSLVSKIVKEKISNL
ncbi:MAG: GatB/YqeY domain-containing protein [Bacilli bacterium]|nr:GatB/YqeY domain-containing protein [Bacilli bacterium]